MVLKAVSWAMCSTCAGLGCSTDSTTFGIVISVSRLMNIIQANLDWYNRWLLNIPNDLFDCPGAMVAVDGAWFMMAPDEVLENDEVGIEANGQWRVQVQQ